MIKMFIGKPKIEPVINFWLEPGSGEDGQQIYLRAKHSDDTSDQLVAVLRKDPEGRIFLETRRLFATKLKSLFGSERLLCVKSQDD